MENAQKIIQASADFPKDSLGRRIGIVKNFSAYSNKMLEGMRGDLGLFMSHSDLVFCRNHYSRQGTSDITLGELYLLDELVKASRGFAKNAAVTELLTDNDDLRDTYSDFFQKYANLYGDDPLPPSLESAAGACSEYLYKIGVYRKAPKQPHELSTDEKFSLKPSSITENTAFAMITPQAEMDDYLSAVRAFMSVPEAEKAIIFARKIGSGGIAQTLCEMSCGIYADLQSVPDMPTPPELSHLVTECHGRVIIATKKRLLSALSEIAEQFGLSLAYFAKAVRSDKLTLSNSSNKKTQIDTALIRALYSSLEGKSFDLRGDAAKYFYRAANTVISAILPTVALGAERSRMRLRTTYRLPKSTASKSLGGSLATILGAYRVMCELCLPDTLGIEYTDTGDISFEASSYMSGNGIHIQDVFRKAGSYVYLLSFDRRASGLPDFASLRGMCDFYREKVVSGKVSSARAIDGTPSETVAKMEGEYRFCTAESAPDILGKHFDGLIVESSEPLNIGILLGKLAPNGENQPL